jgi:hypothetical protein
VCWCRMAVFIRSAVRWQPVQRSLVRRMRSSAALAAASPSRSPIDAVNYLFMIFG